MPAPGRMRWARDDPGEYEDGSRDAWNHRRGGRLIAFTAGLQWALSEAAARHAPLTVLSARHDRAATCTTGDLTQDQTAEEVQALVDQAMSSQSGPVPPVTVQVIPGSPAAELLGAGHDADLLVVGSRGQRRPGPAGVGSVSSQVAYNAACPVVIIFRP